MLTPDMDKYLSKVCADIVDNKTRWEVRAELEAHLEDKVERLMGDGLPESIAADRAIHEMGDPDKLRSTLGQLHSRVPPFDMRSALTKLAFGIFFSSFSIDAWLIRPITQAFGFFLIFTALFQLRKCNSKLKTAFITAAVNFAVRIISSTYGMIPSPGTAVLVVLTVIANAVECTMMYFAYVGLGELGEKYSTPGDVHPIRKYGLYNIALTAAVAVVIIMPPVALLILPMLILYIIFAIKNINSVKNILIAADEGDNVCELRGSGRVLIAGLAVVFIAVPLMLTHIAVTPEIKAEPYVMSDDNGDIREELDELRVENELLKAIPDDELVNLKGAAKATSSFARHELKRGGLVSVYTTSFSFEDKVILVDLVDFDVLPKSRYIDSVFFTTYNYDTSFTAAESDRLLLLYEADGKAYSYEPVNTVYREDGMRLKRVDLRLPDEAEDVKLLRLQTLAVDDALIGQIVNVNTGLTYVNRSSLVCWPYSETESDISYVSDEGVGYTRFNVAGLISTEGDAPLEGGYTVASQDGTVRVYDANGSYVTKKSSVRVDGN